MSHHGGLTVAAWMICVMAAAVTIHGGSVPAVALSFLAVGLLLGQALTNFAAKVAAKYAAK